MAVVGGHEAQPELIWGSGSGGGTTSATTMTWADSTTTGTMPLWTTSGTNIGDRIGFPQVKSNNKI